MELSLLEKYAIDPPSYFPQRENTLIRSKRFHFLRLAHVFDCLFFVPLHQVRVNFLFLTQTCLQKKEFIEIFKQ